MPDYLPVRTDVVVLLVAALLYLTDLCRLLHINEVLFVGRGAKPWSVLTPQDGVLFNRRYAVFPRLYDPGAFPVRVTWPRRSASPESTATALRTQTDTAAGELTFARTVCTLLLPQIFVGIPVAYWLVDSRLPLLILLLAIYLQIVALAIWLLLSRRRLQLRWKTVLLLAFEALVCIPYAINLHRKVAERMAARTHHDVLDTGRALLPAAGQRKLNAHLRLAVERSISTGDDGSGKLPFLEQLRERLMEGAADEPG